MLTYFFAASLSLLVLSQATAQAQTATGPTYMQIFYEGPSWLAGRPLLHYSPALRGKTDETVAEDSTRVLSPGALFLAAEPRSETTTLAQATSISTTNGHTTTTYVRGKDGKMRPQTPTDVQQENTREAARFTRQLNLLDARGALARTALLTALNAAAADGWEVVQLGSWGSHGGLVYLLRRR